MEIKPNGAGGGAVGHPFFGSVRSVICSEKQVGAHDLEIRWIRTARARINIGQWLGAGGSAIGDIKLRAVVGRRGVGRDKYGEAGAEGEVKSAGLV